KLFFIYTNKKESKQSWFSQKHFLAYNHGILLIDKIRSILNENLSQDSASSNIFKIIEAEKLEKEASLLDKLRAFQIYLEEASKGNLHALYKIGLSCNLGWHLHYDQSLLEW